ncbi:hypothetical protein HMPREF9554_00419 [Treponema phagedenis F0421]|nr:hypothetical protein HMPREF9554_00419 [Treponema phagedenis F0421]
MVPRSSDVLKQVGSKQQRCFKAKQLTKLLNSLGYQKTVYYH